MLNISKRCLSIAGKCPTFVIHFFSLNTCSCGTSWGVTISSLPLCVACLLLGSCFIFQNPTSVVSPCINKQHVQWQAIGAWIIVAKKFWSPCFKRGCNPETPLCERPFLWPLFSLPCDPCMTHCFSLLSLGRKIFCVQRTNTDSHIIIPHTFFSLLTAIIGDAFWWKNENQFFLLPSLLSCVREQFPFLNIWTL